MGQQDFLSTVERHYKVGLKSIYYFISQTVTIKKVPFWDIKHKNSLFDGSYTPTEGEVYRKYLLRCFSCRPSGSQHVSRLPASSGEYRGKKSTQYPAQVANGHKERHQGRGPRANTRTEVSRPLELLTIVELEDMVNSSCGSE